MLNKFKQLRKTTNEEGFTLIELMIVVIIIGILAAIAIPIYSNQQKEAEMVSVAKDVKNLYEEALKKNGSTKGIANINCDYDGSTKKSGDCYVVSAFTDHWGTSEPDKLLDYKLQNSGWQIQEVRNWRQRPYNLTHLCAYKTGPYSPWSDGDVWVYDVKTNKGKKVVGLDNCGK